MTPEDWALVNPLLKNLGEAVDDALKTNEKVDTALDEIENSPFKVLLAVEISFGVMKKEDIPPKNTRQKTQQPKGKKIKLLVKDGVIDPSTFNQQDTQKFSKFFGIKLDDDEK